MIKVITKIGEFIVDQADPKNRKNDRISIGIYYNSSDTKDLNLFIKDIWKFEIFMKGAIIFLDSIGITHKDKTYDMTHEDFETIGDFRETKKGFYHMLLLAKTDSNGEGKELTSNEVAKMIENIEKYHLLKDVKILPS